MTVDFREAVGDYYRVKGGQTTWIQSRQCQDRSQHQNQVNLQ